MQRQLAVGPSHRKRRGFGLMELMIVVAIIGILAAIAYPSYTRYIQRSRRTDAHNILLRIAAEQERHYTSFNRYATTLNGAAPAGLGFAGNVSENRFYVVTLSPGITGDSQSFLLQADANPDAQFNQQALDVCGSLTLASSGIKNFTGEETNGACWQSRTTP